MYKFAIKPNMKMKKMLKITKSKKFYCIFKIIVI